MMHRLLLALIALSGLPGAAQACSCVAPESDAGTTCDDGLLSDPSAIDLIREEARKMGRPLGG